MIDELIHELRQLHNERHGQRRVAERERAFGLAQRYREQCDGIIQAINVVKDFKKQHRIGN